MNDLRELYQSVILDHYKKPRNFGALADATSSAQGVNPLCGDHVTVHVRLDQDRIDALRFEGSGCAISKASASLMTEILSGKSLDEAEQTFERFHDLVASGADANRSDLGKLEVLSGVREFPARVKCATLAWHALRAALAGERHPVTTE